jgi:hypothetical protein
VSNSESTPVVRGGPIVEAMTAIRRAGPQGATVPVREVAPGSWDSVHLFRDGTSWEAIRKQVGAASFPDEQGRYLGGGALLVFAEGGRATSAVEAIPPLMVSTQSRGLTRADAVFRAHTKDPGPYLLVLEAAK